MGWWFHIFTWLGNGCLTKHLFEKNTLFGSSRVVILTEKTPQNMRWKNRANPQKLPYNQRWDLLLVWSLQYIPTNPGSPNLNGFMEPKWTYGVSVIEHPKSSAKKYDHWCLGHGKHHHTHTGSLYVYLHWIYLYVCRLDPPQYTCINDPCLNPPPFRREAPVILRICHHCMAYGVRQESHPAALVGRQEFAKSCFSRLPRVE